MPTGSVRSRSAAAPPRTAPGCRDGAARRTVEATGASSTIDARVHHVDALGEVAHHAEIVGDQQHRGAGGVGRARASARASGPARSRRAPCPARRPAPAPGRLTSAMAIIDALVQAAAELEWIGVEHAVGIDDRRPRPGPRARSARAASGPLAFRPRRRMTVVSWSSTVKTGFSAATGSWKIIAMRRPRSRSHPAGSSRRRSSPSKLIAPAIAHAADLESPMIKRGGQGLAAARFADQRDPLARRTTVSRDPVQDMRGRRRSPIER